VTTIRSATPRALAAGVAVLVATPSALFAQEEGGTAIMSLNLGLVIWTWVLFLLTLGILAWKVFPFIAGGLEERQRKIQESIDQARRSRDEAQALLDDQNQTLEAARREAQDLIEKSRATAESLKKDILAEAKEQQGAMLADARRDLDMEREQLREDLRREAVEISLSVAERLIRTRLDADENRRLVEEYVSELR
jgi:F-type H+-transporting ATPase subunit b